MRKAMVAKLGLTAAVGLGTLFGHGAIAQAETPPKQLDQTGDVIFVPAPPTTIKPLEATPVNPCAPITCLPAEEVDPEEHSCGPIDCIPAEEVDPTDDCAPHVLCTDEKAPVPDEPDPGCPEIVLTCDLTSDPGCTITHGECPGDEGGTGGEGHGGTDGGDEGTDQGGDEGTDGDQGTTGGDETDDGGSTGGGSLPRTGAELATWAIAGVGLTGAGAALRKLGKRGA